MQTLTARGWKVFPLIKNTKKPATKNGFYDAVNSPEEINKFPGGCNFGVATGGDFWVLDVDVKSGARGRETLDNWIKRYGPLPETLKIGTPSGGEHYYFKQPQPPFRTKIHRTAGIDVKSDGGYVVTPPSKIDGKPYFFISDPAATLADTPEWLIDSILALKEREAALPLTGCRNDSLTRIAGGLRAKGMDNPELYNQLAEFNKTLPEPLPEFEVRAISNSIIKYPIGENYPRAYDHAGLAQYLSDKNVGQIKYIPALGWFAYDNGYWTKDNAEQIITNKIVEQLTDLKIEADVPAVKKKCDGTRSNVDSIMHLLKFVKGVYTSISDMQDPPHLLNCNNGILNLKTLELKPHAPEFNFLYKLDTNWNPTADYTKWEDFVYQSACLDSDNYEQVNYLKLAAGYSITGEICAEKMFYIHGPARSGKSTFMSAIQNLLGTLSKPININSLQENTGANDTQNFAMAGLRGIRFVTSSETDKNTRLIANKIKEFTGGSIIRAAFKCRDAFEFLPRFKIWLSSNHEINMDGGDEAAWSRFIFFSFPTSHAYTPDPTLKNALLGDLEPVLRWLAEGSQEWYAIRNMDMPESGWSKSYKTDRRMELDYVQEFLDSHNYCPGPDFKSVKELYDLFLEYCQKNHIYRPLWVNAFSMDLRAKGFGHSRQRVNGIRINGVFLGIKTE